MTSRFWINAIILTLFSMSTLAEAAPRRRVGLVVQLAVNVKPKRQTEWAEQVGRALRTVEKVDVIAGAEVERRLPPGGLPEACAQNEACRKELSERLEARELLFLVLVKVGRKLQIESTWVDVETGDEVTRDAILLRLKKRGVRKALEKAVVGLLPPEPVPAAPPPSTFAQTPPPPVKSPPAPAPPPVIAPAPAPSPGIGWPVYAAAGVSVVALSVGIGFGLSASSDESGLLDDRCNEVVCENIDDRISTMNNKALIADVMFGVAAAGAVTTVVLYLTGDSEPPPVAFQVAPNRDGASVGLGGTF